MYFRFLYTEEARLAGVSFEKVMQLAEKYEVRELIKCLLEDQLNGMRVDDFCPFVHKYEDHMIDVLKFKCLEYVFKQPYAVFQSGTFQQLPLAFLKEILGHERLVMQEDNICTAVLLWASKSCEIHNKEVNGKNQREALSDVLYLIRFPLLSQDYFTENVSEKELLTPQEEVQLLKYFLTKKNPPEHFIATKREAPSTPFAYVPLKPGQKLPSLNCGLHAVGSFPILSPDIRSGSKYVSRFSERGIGWGYRNDKTDAIGFTVDKDIVLTHVYVYGLCRDNGDMNVNMIVRDEHNHDLSCTELKVRCDIKNETGLYEVGVENAVGSYGVRLNSRTKYHVVLSIKTGNTFYGKSGKEECFADGATFEFFDSEFSTNNTSVKIGQVAGMKFTMQ